MKQDTEINPCYRREAQTYQAGELTNKTIMGLVYFQCGCKSCDHWVCWNECKQ